MHQRAHEGEVADVQFALAAWVGRQQLGTLIAHKASLVKTGQPPETAVLLNKALPAARRPCAGRVADALFNLTGVQQRSERGVLRFMQESRNRFQVSGVNSLIATSRAFQRQPRQRLG